MQFHAGSTVISIDFLMAFSGFLRIFHCHFHLPNLVAPGEWEAPMIDNPEYKGEWTVKRISNPAYKGVWEAKKIANPEFVDSWCWSPQCQ